jgi:uncharacterized protein (UPF0248 family)
MTYPREVLNELKWKPGMSLDKAEITYIHRGAPRDEMTIQGSDIIELERSFFVTQESKIPYHRIKRIVYEGKLLFDIHRFEMEKDDGKETG